MSNQTLSTSMITIKDYQLSVTTRDCGDDMEVLKQLTFRTIGAWLYLAERIEKGELVLPEEVASVQDRYVEFVRNDPAGNKDFALPNAWGDSRVTVWDSYRGKKYIAFHLNSDDLPQTALNVWCANQGGITMAAEHFNTVARQVTPAQPAPAGERPATPKAQNTPPNGQAPLLSKKDAIAKLNAGDPFRMKVVQIEKHSKDGSDYYDFFEPMGNGKAGQYSSKTVYADNEIALNNGLITYLDSMGIGYKQALTGNWIVNAVVGKPKTRTVKGEEKTYTDIFINSFEGQPQPA